MKSMVKDSQDTSLVIKDKENGSMYSSEEIKNKIILGDTFKVLKKIPDETVDGRAMRI